MFVGQSSKLFRAKSKRLKILMRTRQGETICLGEWIRPASALFPPAGGVWGGMRAGFGTDLFSKPPQLRPVKLARHKLIITYLRQRLNLFFFNSPKNYKGNNKKWNKGGHCQSLIACSYRNSTK